MFLENLFSLQGRLSRKMFFFEFLLWAALGWLPSKWLLYFGGYSIILNMLALAAVVLSSWGWICAMVRRLRDTGRSPLKFLTGFFSLGFVVMLLGTYLITISPAYVLPAYVPFFMWLYLLYVLFLQKTKVPEKPATLHGDTTCLSPSGTNPKKEAD